MGQIEVVQFEVRRADGRPTGVREIRQFETGGDAPSLESQITESQLGEGTEVPASVARGRRYTRIAVLPNIEDL